ncbi:MAG: hypothetical protein Q8M15_01900 [Bacteroidota bacterium]|nr:hypothetical protein [Bacteroidota bacterium]
MASVRVEAEHWMGNGVEAEYWVVTCKDAIYGVSWWKPNIGY